MSRDGTDPVARGAPDLDGTELLGTVIADRYHLECVLGRGGMGLVYRAAHLGLRRQVAVKILHPSLVSSTDVRNRFDREAYAAGKIDHPNCINVMDSGKLPDGTRYLAMELLDGKSLADVLEHEGQIAPGRALHILAHILRGLGHIHNAGLIHRDIKPENIFLIRQSSDEDFAKILDFGIAKGMGKTDLEEGVKLTQAGMAFGTPIYMAPEQALGNPMDGRADLYAAAVLGYEMLCGQPPFYSDDKLEVMSMHTAKPVPPMRQRLIKGGRPVPSSIERLIVKGLTKKPSERYANADIFLAAVEEALETPDGGVTDVSFERPNNTTGSQPLVSADGQVAIADGSEEIGAAIDDVLMTPHPPMPVVKPPAVKPPVLPAVSPKRDSQPPPRGGVGLGLPYTGPTGEPIFGLTPEQRLAQADLAADRSQIAPALEPDESMMLAATRSVTKKPKWPVYAMILGAAVVVGVVIAVLTVPRGNDDDVVEEIDPETPAGKALTEYKLGQLNDALTILKADPERLANDGEMQLVLGHVHASKSEHGPALDAYGKSLVMRPDLAADEELAKHLRTMSKDKDPLVAMRAFDLWIRTPDPQAKPQLLAAAVDQDMARRHAVKPVIERHGLSDKVEWYQAYGLDLQQEPSCPKRKEAVARLRALGDPRSLVTLEQAFKKPLKSNPRYRHHACIQAELRAAISDFKK